MSTPMKIRQIDRFEKSNDHDEEEQYEEEEEEYIDAPPKEEFIQNLEKFGIDGCMSHYKKRRQTIHDYCIYYNIEIPSKGRRKQKISQEIIDMVIQKRGPDGFNTGYQSLAYELNQEGTKVSEKTIRRIYEEQHLFTFNKKKETENLHPNSFVAKFTNQLWHTDLHEIERDSAHSNEKRYIIGFIDDRSRLLIHHEIIFSKTALKTGKALKHALKKVPNCPHCITIDNGGEFIGNDFQKVLKKFKIEDYRTHPYTPEENGKIERWWRTMESKRSKNKELTKEYLDDLVYHYNCLWPHTSLRKLTGRKMTPKEAWETMEKWNNGKAAEIEYLNH